MTAHDTVLITGGAGFIGSNLAQKLASRGHEVTLVDSLHPQVHTGTWPALLSESGISQWPFDVTVSTQWDALFKMIQPSLIVHLAAETGTGQSLLEASRHGRVNVLGTAEMLDGLSRAGHVPERFVLASSRAIYGEGMWMTDVGSSFHAPLRDLCQLEAAQWDPQSPENTEVWPLPHHAERVEPRPSSVYAATKLAQEHILRSWVTARGTALYILRLQNVYGPGQSLTNPYTGIVSLFAKMALEHKSIPVYEDGRIVRDFVFIEDAVTALAAACASERDSVTILDIGSGKSSTLLELANEIARQTGAPSPTITGAFRLGDVRSAFADLSIAKQIIGYSPLTTLSEGIRLLLQWITDQ